MSKKENENLKEEPMTKNNLLSNVNEDFTPLINILYKAMDNYKNITIYNIKEINKILLSLENNLLSSNKIKITNIKTLLTSSEKGLKTYLNDTKIALNNILIKSKEISLNFLNFKKSQSSINNLILSSEIKQKETEMNNLVKELNYYKNKYNSVNKSLIDSQKIISELKDENFEYREKMIETNKNLYIKNRTESEISKEETQSFSSIKTDDKILKIEIKELNNKIKELNNTIDNCESQISQMTDRNTNLSKLLSKKNLDYTELQKENMEKMEENNKLKDLLEKNNNKEREYNLKINEYQKNMEENDKIITKNNKTINVLNDTIKSDKIKIKSLEAEIEKLQFEMKNKEAKNENSDNEYINVLKDLELCRMEKENLEKQLEDMKTLLDKNKNEYKKKIKLMESTISHNNNMINDKDKIINDLKSQKNIKIEEESKVDDDEEEEEKEKEDKNDDNNFNQNMGMMGNVNIINNEFKEVYEKLKEKDLVIKTKDEKIKELTDILENAKKNSKENIIYQKIQQYKNDEISNQSIIKVLKEQIKDLETEIKKIKEESEKKKEEELSDVVAKMVKLSQEIDKYKNKNQKLQKELNNYKNGNNTGNVPEINEDNSEKIDDLKNQLKDLENKYNKEKNINKEYEADIEKYKQKISDLNSQIVDLKIIIKTYNNKNNNNDDNNNNNKNIRYLKDSSNQNFDIEKYNDNLIQLVNAKKEISILKSQIQKFENEKKKTKESLFKYRSILDDNFEEEFDMAQIEEGVKKKNRSEDLNIDFPGNSETKKKYEELAERFNNLKEQVVPILKSNANKNLNKNNVANICNLLGTSVNTTSNILEKYNK